MTDLNSGASDGVWKYFQYLFVVSAQPQSFYCLCIDRTSLLLLVDLHVEEGVEPIPAREQNTQYQWILFLRRWNRCCRQTTNVRTDMACVLTDLLDCRDQHLVTLQLHCILRLLFSDVADFASL